MEILKVVVTVFIAVVGWIIGHRLNSKSDAEANRKKIVTEYLLDAYRKLNGFAGVWLAKANAHPTLAEDVNSAIGDIQLFGSPKQIQLTKELSEQFTNNCVSGDILEALLIRLRNDLRNELELEAVDTSIAHLWLTHQDSSTTSCQKKM